eukprot:5271932-Amphidinium_carterae.1
MPMQNFHKRPVIIEGGNSSEHRTALSRTSSKEGEPVSFAARIMLLLRVWGWGGLWKAIEAHKLIGHPFPQALLGDQSA